MSKDFPYNYVNYPIELVAPKSIQNVDIDDESVSLNFTLKLEPDSCPNRPRTPVDFQTLSNNLIAYDSVKLKPDVFTPDRAHRIQTSADKREIETEIPHFGQEPILRETSSIGRSDTKSNLLTPVSANCFARLRDASDNDSVSK